MTRCSSTRKGPCRCHPGTGKHCCKIQRLRHVVVRHATFEAPQHECRCGEKWQTSRALGPQKGLAE